MLLEQIEKMIGTMDAHRLSNFADAERRRDQKIFGPVKPHPIQILVRGDADVLFEQVAEMIFVFIELGSQAVQIDRIPVMIFEVGADLFDFRRGDRVGTGDPENFRQDVRQRLIVLHFRVAGTHAVAEVELPDAVSERRVFGYRKTDSVLLPDQGE